MSLAPRFQEADPNSRRTPILVVDDDPVIRRAIQRVLEGEGFGVETAGDIGEALVRTARHRPALVILDMILPIASGATVADALRAAHGEGLPIILITADGQAARKARQIRASGYLRKPFDLDALVTAVRAALPRD